MPNTSNSSYARHFTIMDYISDMEAEVKKAAYELYKNPRIKNVTMSCETLMGCSVTYTSDGDPDSPECKAQLHNDGLAEAKYIDKQNAIQNNTGPTGSYPAASKESPRNIPGGLQQWV